MTLSQAHEKIFYIASCGQCKRAVEIDLVAMIDRLGADFEMQALRPRLKCARCGSRQIISTTLWKDSTTTSQLRKQILANST